MDAPCDLCVEVASTRVRAGSRSAVDKLTIFAKQLLAIALADEAMRQHLRAVEMRREEAGSEHDHLSLGLDVSKRAVRCTKYR